MRSGGLTEGRRMVGVAERCCHRLARSGKRVAPRARPTRAQARPTVVDPILSGFSGKPGEPVSGQLSSSAETVESPGGRPPGGGPEHAPGASRPPGNRSSGAPRRRPGTISPVTAQPGRHDSIPPPRGIEPFVRVLACTARVPGSEPVRRMLSGKDQRQPNARSPFAQLEWPGQELTGRKPHDLHAAAGPSPRRAGLAWLRSAGPAGPGRPAPGTSARRPSTGYDVCEPQSNGGLGRSPLGGSREATAAPWSRRLELVGGDQANIDLTEVGGPHLPI